MKKISGLSIFLFIITFSISAQQDSVLYRVVLLGDGGELGKDGRHAVTEAVLKNIPLNENTTVLLMGDNIYKKGLPKETDTSGYNKSIKIIDAQLAVGNNSKAKVFVIPGNHDWDDAKAGGWEAIKRQQRLVDEYANDSVKFLPKDGCPGPVELNVSSEVTVVIFDSQWWLHKHDKPKEGSPCECDTKDELVNKIKNIAQRNKDKILIIASHHPFKSAGPHGGYYTIKQHLFPLTDIKKLRWFYLPMPVIGSIYPLIRGGIGTPQDLKNKNYRDMVNRIETAAGEHPNVIFAAGHEHSLQLYKEKNFTYIVSGGACKSSRLNKKKTIYGAASQGFAVLEISKNKNVSVKFYTVKEKTELQFSSGLMNLH